MYNFILRFIILHNIRNINCKKNGNDFFVMILIDCTNVCQYVNIYFSNMGEGWVFNSCIPSSFPPVSMGIEGVQSHKKNLYQKTLKIDFTLW